VCERRPGVWQHAFDRRVFAHARPDACPILPGVACPTLVVDVRPRSSGGFPHATAVAPYQARPRFCRFYRVPAVPPSSAQAAPISLKDISRKAAHAAEREAMLQALEQTKWNRIQVAKLLGISYRALLYKIKEAELYRRSASNPRRGRDP
jgi:hypothetical protein